MQRLVLSRYFCENVNLIHRCNRESEKIKIDNIVLEDSNAMMDLNVEVSARTKQCSVKMKENSGVPVKNNCKDVFPGCFRPVIKISFVLLKTIPIYYSTAEYKIHTILSSKIELIGCTNLKGTQTLDFFNNSTLSTKSQYFLKFEDCRKLENLNCIYTKIIKRKHNKRISSKLRIKRKNAKFALQNEMNKCLSITTDQSTNTSSDDINLEENNQKLASDTKRKKSKDFQTDTKYSIDVESEEQRAETEIIRTDIFNNQIDFETKYFKQFTSGSFHCTSTRWKYETKDITQLTHWIPPQSPHNLIEEVLYHDPWALLVATIFLNKTSCRLARPYVFWFLMENPGPMSLMNFFPKDLEKYFYNLGLRKTRAVQIWRMTHDYLLNDWKKPSELYGIGGYGDCAYRMFCLGDFSVEPKDRILRIYKEWYEKIFKNSEELKNCET